MSDNHLILLDSLIWKLNVKFLIIFLPSCVRLKRPVRCMLDRDEDMLVTGGRHPFYGKYKVGGRPLLERQL